MKLTAEELFAPELIISGDVVWPAFRKIYFLHAIRAYQARFRRFGRRISARASSLLTLTAESSSCLLLRKYTIVNHVSQNQTGTTIRQFCVFQRIKARRCRQ